MDILLCYANFNTILKQSQYLKSYWENEDNSKKERFDVDIQMLTKEEAKDYPYEK